MGLQASSQMYSITLIVHSWLRYPVLALGLALLLLAATALRSDSTGSVGTARTHTVFIIALDIQLVLGLLLYFVLSPIAPQAFADMGAAMRDPQLRFFAVEHIATMLLAVAVVHIGRVRSRRALGRDDGRAGTRIVLRSQILWLVLTVAAIPWPGLDIARPIFRLQ